jgi:hypothetical protein
MPERNELRELMRSTFAERENARVHGHTNKLEALIELARASYGLQAFHQPPDPIITATLALVLGNSAEAMNLYLEALRQNRSFPDEKSYEWRLHLAARFLPTGEVPHAVAELRECRAQALDAGDHQAVLRADGLLASLPTPARCMHCYTDGSELHAGQRIAYSGQPGTVVFVIDNEEYAPGFASTAWEDLNTGFMIRFDNGAMLHLDRPDEHLVRVPDDGTASPA